MKIISVRKGTNILLYNHGIAIEEDIDEYNYIYFDWVDFEEFQELIKGIKNDEGI